MSSVVKLDRSVTVPLTLTVYRSFDDVNALQQNWDTFAERTGGLIYQTYAWCRVWWDHYGHGRELRLILVRSGNEWVGLLPLFIDYLGFWPIGARVAKGIGTEYSTSRLALMILDDFRLPVLNLVCTQLIQDDGCHLISLGPILDAERLGKDISSAAGSNQVEVSVHPSDSRVLMTYDLDGGFDAMMARISSGRRANLRRSMRKVEDQNGVVVRRTLDGNEICEEFESFCELHRQRWVLDGKQGHFDDWPDSKSFHREMIVAQAKHARCRLYKITRRDEIVAYEYGYAFGEWYFWLLPARSISEEWERLSIGQVSSLIQMRTEASEGIRHADLGQGFYDYKKSMGASSEKLDRVSIERQGITNRIRLQFWRLISKLIHVVFYKIWIIRLRPRLTLRSKPLWSLWIRTRI